MRSKEEEKEGRLTSFLVGLQPHNILLSERFTDSLNVISPTQLRYTAFSVNVHMNELLVAVESQDKTSFNKIPYSFYLSGTRDYLLLPEGPYMAAEARGYLSSESVIQRGYLHLPSADQLLVLLVPKWDSLISSGLHQRVRDALNFPQEPH